MTIQLNNVRFAYAGASGDIVDIDHWQVAAGEKVFVQGPSGSGKSTLLNLLSGMLLPVSGEVSVLGQPLNTMSSRQRDKFRAAHIGYVFQQFNLISYLNAIENIQLASHFSTKEKPSVEPDQIASLLSALNIVAADRAKPVTKLSMGQQQRIAIARAMINKPEILIADEPTSSLDVQNRDTFMAELTTLASAQGTTLVFVSHDTSLARYFDRVDSLADINKAGECH